MILDNINVTGDITAILYDEFGNVKDRLDVHNLVVTIGKNIIASRLVGTASAVVSHMAVGSGTTAPSAAQTALTTEMTRVAISTGTASGNVATYVATFGPGVGTGSINECGLFNSATPGAANSILARSTSVVVTKGALDTLAITWTVTIN